MEMQCDFFELGTEFLRCFHSDEDSYCGLQGYDSGSEGHTASIFSIKQRCTFSIQKEAINE
jgi:hypothetical protein